MAMAMTAPGKGEAGASCNLPWVEKYRPVQLDDVVAQSNIINTIERLIDAQRLPHLLFYGPPGTGKTSTILACARKMYGAKRMSSMVLELNASDERGIDVVRDKIKSFASTQTIFASGCKLIILDEADAMTKAAQFSLRRIIEKYTKNTRFCLIANYTNRIIPALQSRCTKFRFAPLDDDSIKGRILQVAELERVDISDDGLAALMDLAQGDMRKVFNQLQSVHGAYGKVTADSVHSCSGTPRPVDVELTLQHLLNSEFNEARRAIAELLLDRGLSLVDMVSRISALLLLVDDIPEPVLAFALAQLALLEHRLTLETCDRIQLPGLVGIFVLVRDRTMAYYQATGQV